MSKPKKIPEKKEITPGESHVNIDDVFGKVEVIEPDNTLLDNFISKKKVDERAEKQSPGTTFSGSNLGDLILKPIFNMLNMVFDQTPLTSIDDKSINQTAKDFDKILLSFPETSTVSKWVTKIAKERPYLPFIADIAGITICKVYEYKKLSGNKKNIQNQTKDVVGGLWGNP